MAWKTHVTECVWSEAARSLSLVGWKVLKEDPTFRCLSKKPERYSFLGPVFGPHEQDKVAIAKSLTDIESRLTPYPVAGRGGVVSGRHVFAHGV